MAVTATPIFVQTVKNASATTSTANTGRDGSGTISTLCTAGANGSKVFTIVVNFEVTTTAGTVRLYISSDNGTTWDMFEEIYVPAITVSASQPAFRWEKSYDNLVLVATNGKIGFAPHAAEAVTATAFYGDY